MYKHINKMATALIKSLFATELKETATYKKFDSNTYDPSTGKNTSTYSNYSVKVIRSNTALEAQGASTVLSAIGFDAGEMFFFVQATDIPRTSLYDPDILKDYIIIDNRDYLIKKCVPIHNIFVKLQV